jgi:hypothetical protein
MIVAPCAHVPACAAKSEFVYLTTHGARTRALEFDISEHRDRCTLKLPGSDKLRCPVQSRVGVCVADMGGQVSSTVDAVVATTADDARARVRSRR